MRQKYIESLLILALFFHLQWFFGNFYEEILIPNQIVASIRQLNEYNRFFCITQPVYYYVPLTQIGFLITLFLAFVRSDLHPATTRLIRWAATTSLAAIALTFYIVTQYNLKMFFGDVDRFGEHIHALYLQWAMLNGVRIILVGVTVTFLAMAYRRFLIGRNTGEEKVTTSN